MSESIEIERPTIFNNSKIACGIAKRYGGISKNEFSSLNVSFSVGDEKENVISNRHLFFDSIKYSPESAVICKQTHSSNIKIITDEDLGKGVLDYDSAIYDCDGLITNIKNIVLCILLADCLGIFIYDPRRKVIAAIHSGWRGTYQKILKSCLNKLKSVFNTNPSDCLVYFTPSIKNCCYEVGENFVDIFGCFVEHRYGKYFFDNDKTNLDILNSFGIPDTNIEVSSICTASTTDFFSHRRDNGKTGRNISYIVMK